MNQTQQIIVSTSTIGAVFMFLTLAVVYYCVRIRPKRKLFIIQLDSSLRNEVEHQLFVEKIRQQQQRRQHLQQQLQINFFQHQHQPDVPTTVRSIEAEMFTIQNQFDFSLNRVRGQGHPSLTSIALSHSIDLSSTNATSESPPPTSNAEASNNYLENLQLNVDRRQTI